MLSITGLSLRPVKKLKSRKCGVNRRSYLADCPPPTDITHEWDFGAYCFKASVDDMILMEVTIGRSSGTVKI